MVDAEKFSLAGDKYIGTSYSEMDCQAFVERCMRDCGMKKDLGGSNSWYRECIRTGWTGTPEECMRTFGSIPKGALLFILKQDGKEPAKFRSDGIGNASHIGIKTGRGEGAIHSSSSKGCVATSKFKDRSIANGGWNRVGLLSGFDYGKTVNWMLAHIGIGAEPKDGKKEETKIMKAVVKAPNGGKVKLRQSNDPNSRLYGIYDEIPSYTTVDVESQGTKWCWIHVGSRTGWMMTEFLEIIADDSRLPAEDPDDFTRDDQADDQDGTVSIALRFTADELSRILPVLEKAVDQIIETVGRG